MNKILLLFLSLPIIFIVLIFILINKNHQNNPERLACSSFKTALRKSVPLHVSETVFKNKTDEMCQCFINNNDNRIANSISSAMMDICSKKVIFEWIMPSEKFTNKDAELCFKENVYKEIILPFVREEQNITFSKGVFRNDVLNYNKRDIHRKNINYQDFLKKCNN